MKCLICNCDIPNRQKFAIHLSKEHNINTLTYKSIYKPDKDEKLLECPICGQYNIKQLTHHLTWKHNLTKEDFLAKYPDTKLWIDEISERCARAQQLGIETYRDNLKENPNYYDDVYKKRSQNRNYDEIAEKTKLTRIKNHSNEKMSIRVKKLWQNEDYRKLQSDKAKEQHKNGLTKIIMDKAGKKRYNITLNNIEYSMRSTWEVKLATFLYENNIEFEYEPFAIKYMFNNKEKLYYPDFYIKKTNLILEVKPLNLCNNEMVIAKRLSCINKGYNYMFITENELDKLNTIKFE
jgi:hypothetical protein